MPRKGNFLMLGRTKCGRYFNCLIILQFVIGTAFLFHPARMLAAAGDAPSSAAVTDEARLMGRWVRPDGGYVLELGEVGSDGSLKAAYFNPRPINVGKAEVIRKEGALVVFIELRDVNYPGSTYRLRYDPKTDRLIGTYFQALQRETYEIELERVK